ncbi:hypothetical protein HK102_010278 [Quaeritorhiza haematococci]|nr:hypothetical protein HK102_010278 [Quaeritorhiza haematococci]
MEIVTYPLLYPDVVSKMNIDYPTGVLLHGPPGVGKTLLVSTVAKACQAKMVTIQGPEVLGSNVGESEEKLKAKFEEAKDWAFGTAAERKQHGSPIRRPCIIFIDEMDALAPNRSDFLGKATNSHESRVVLQLLALIDELKTSSCGGSFANGSGEEEDTKSSKAHVGIVIVGATNRPNAIDRSLRRPGRFDREIAIDVPSESERLKILKSSTQHIPLSLDVDLNILNIFIATMTNGYVGADLSALCREAAFNAVRSNSSNAPTWYTRSHLITIKESHFASATRELTTIISRTVTHADFLQAHKSLRPSLHRSSLVFNKSSPPKSSDSSSPAKKHQNWSDVGGLDEVKLKLQQCVEWPLKYRDTFERLGIDPPKGILLYGPPGCSKTTMVKIIAASSGLTFLSLNGASLYSAYVGESEQMVRATFHRARLAAPSVIFFDEIDAIVGKRALEGKAGGDGGGPSVHERVLSTLLNEMDGIEGAKAVLVVVTAPDAKARESILRIHTRRMTLGTDVDLARLAGEDLTARYTGADLEALCREAALSALRDEMLATKGGGQAASGSCLKMDHFLQALKMVPPSLSEEMLAQYRMFSEQFG